jgi:hypothetical protein
MMGVATARPDMMRVSPFTITTDPLTTAGTIIAHITTVRRTRRLITRGTTIAGTAATTRKTRIDGQIGPRWVSNPSLLIFS